MKALDRYAGATHSTPAAPPRTADSKKVRPSAPGPAADKRDERAVLVWHMAGDEARAVEIEQAVLKRRVPCRRWCSPTAGDDETALRNLENALERTALIFVVTPADLETLPAAVWSEFDALFNATWRQHRPARLVARRTEELGKFAPFRAFDKYAEADLVNGEGDSGTGSGARLVDFLRAADLVPKESA